MEESAPKNFAKFTGKYLRQSLVFKNVLGLSVQLYKKETLAQVFPASFVKFLRAPFHRKTTSVTPKLMSMERLR